MDNLRNDENKRLQRSFQALREAVKKVETAPDSFQARRHLTRAVEQFLWSMPTEEVEHLAQVLDRSLGALTGATALARIHAQRTLITPEILAKSPLAQEAFEQRKTLAEKGELLRSDQLQERLVVSRQAISKRVKSGTLFYVDGEGGTRYYPAFFADLSLDLDKVKEVNKALGPLPGASKWLFFTLPRISLGGVSPLDIIKGKLTKVGDSTESTDRRIVGFEDVLRAAYAAAST